MKILAYPSPSNARLYRLDQIGEYIEKQSRNYFYVSMEAMNEQDLDKADVVILQQTISPKKIRLAKEVCNTKGKLLVAELDDFFGVNPDNPFKDKHKELEAAKWLETLCGVADMITTTTDYLAETIRKTLKKHNVEKDIFVLPNYLDIEKWDLPILKNYTDEIRLVWAGSCSHRDDIKFIAPVIKKLAKKYPQLKFIHCGDVDLQPLFKDINSEYVEAVNVGAWPAKLHSLRADIGVAPLLDNEFNRNKSNLKYLEYGISGIPSVYSNVVYSKTIKDEETGLLAQTEEEFFDKLEKLITDIELRNKIGANAYIDVRTNYDIKNHISKWLNAYWLGLSKKRKLKIDIGSGIQPQLGLDYILLDANPSVGEMVNDILEGIPVADNSVEKLHCSAIIEHFYLNDLKEKVLPEFYRILKKDGEIYIVVPDWSKIKKSDDWEMVQNNLYGVHHSYIPIKYDIHKYCWDFKHLKEVLEKVGFKEIKEIKYTEKLHNPNFTLALEAKKL